MRRLRRLGLWLRVPGPRPRPRPAARPGAGAAQCPPAPPRGGPQPPGLGCQPAAAGGGRRRQRPWRPEPEPAQQQETQDGAAEAGLLSPEQLLPHQPRPAQPRPRPGRGLGRGERRPERRQGHGEGEQQDGAPDDQGPGHQRMLTEGGILAQQHEREGVCHEPDQALHHLRPHQAGEGRESRPDGEDDADPRGRRHSTVTLAAKLHNFSTPASFIFNPPGFRRLASQSPGNKTISWYPD